MQPIIIAEHDALLVKEIPNSLFELNEPIAFGYLGNLYDDRIISKKFRRAAATAYYLTPKHATMMWETHKNPGQAPAHKEININVDGNIEGFINFFHNINTTEEMYVTQILHHNLGSGLNHRKKRKNKQFTAYIPSKSWKTERIKTISNLYKDSL